MNQLSLIMSSQSSLVPLSGSRRIYNLLPAGDLALIAKSSQWRLLERQIQNELNHDLELIRDQNIHDHFRQRIKKFRENRLRYLAQLGQVFSDLPKNSESASDAHHALLKLEQQRKPLIAYPRNLFRDWAWGEKENDIYLDFVKRNLPADFSPKRVLVLAAGAGRLAYDVHQCFSPELTVALDQSYFFGSCFDKILSPDGLEITEFTDPPRDESVRAINHKLHSKEPSQGELCYVLGDIHQLPFNSQSFDLIITPWIIDLIPKQLPLLIYNISALLSPSAYWLNFGSFAISNDIPSEFRWTYDEVKGFFSNAQIRLTNEEFFEVDYIRSPYSPQYRREILWGFATQNVSSQIKPLLAQTNEHEFLKFHDRPIPRSIAMETTAMAHHVPARLFDLIDGKRSLNQVSHLMAQEFGLDMTATRASLLVYLSHWIKSET